MSVVSGLIAYTKHPHKQGKVDRVLLVNKRQKQKVDRIDLEEGQNAEECPTSVLKVKAGGIIPIFPEKSPSIMELHCRRLCWNNS